MTERRKAFPLALVMFTITHLLIVGATYGTMTSEMRSFNKTLSEVVGELKITNLSIHLLEKSDLGTEIEYKHIKKRISKLESKHP